MRTKAVDVKCGKTGPAKGMPLTMEWGGRELEIERVVHSCRSADGEYSGTRYTVVINGEEKFLYRDGIGWYVSLKEETT